MLEGREKVIGKLKEKMDSETAFLFGYRKQKKYLTDTVDFTGHKPYQLYKSNIKGDLSIDPCRHQSSVIKQARPEF